MSSEERYAHQHERHANRNDLAGEHRLGDTFQLVFLFLFLALWILDSFVFRYSTFLAGSIPVAIRWAAGILLLGLSLYLSRAGLKLIFGEIREKPFVITKGAFSLVRHPIYLGSILFYGGLFCLTLSLLSAGLWILIIVFYRYISGYEEKLLINRFGEEYLAYREKVPMLFPLKIKS